jgi:hypothetical protein
MQFLDGKLLFSASDLINFLGCKHATYLDLGDLNHPVTILERDAATLLIFEKGIEHEKRYLAALKARAVSVVEITAEDFDIPERTRLSREAIRCQTASNRDPGSACKKDPSPGVGTGLSR